MGRLRIKKKRKKGPHLCPADEMPYEASKDMADWMEATLIGRGLTVERIECDDCNAVGFREVELEGASSR